MTDRPQDMHARHAEVLANDAESCMNRIDNWRGLYPFQSHFLPLDSLRYHYLDEGQRDVLLMVHGNPTWSFYWRNLVLAFRGRYRAVVPDHIGCGMSDKPASYAYTLQQHISNLVRLIEHLDLTDITLMAHDWGGPIGLGAALAVPERFSRFVLFNTGAFPPSSIPFRIRACRMPLLGRLAVQGWNVFARAALWMAVEKHDRMTPAVKSGLIFPYDSWDHRIAIDRFVQDIPLSRRHPTWQVLADMEEKLPTLSGRPFQFIWGGKDWCFTEACLDRFVEMFPDAGVNVLPDAGHYVLEDAHERIIPLVESFLAQHSIRPAEGQCNC